MFLTGLRSQTLSNLTGIHFPSAWKEMKSPTLVRIERRDVIGRRAPQTREPLTWGTIQFCYFQSTSSGMEVGVVSRRLASLEGFGKSELGASVCIRSQ